MTMLRGPNSLKGRQFLIRAMEVVPVGDKSEKSRGERESQNKAAAP